VTPGDGDKYLPTEAGDGPTPSAEDIAYADDFVVVARAVESCSRSEEVTLLISTCRNHWMTVNAAFADLRDAVGADSLPDPISRAIYELRREHWNAADGLLINAAIALSQIDVKLKVWTNRQALLEELWSSARALSELRDRQRMMRLLEAHGGVASTDDHDADGRYVALSTEEHDGAGQLLREIRQLRMKLGAVVAACRAVRASATPEIRSLWDVEPEARDEDSPEWATLITQLDSSGWSGDSEGRSLSHVLKLPLPDRAWPGVEAAEQFRTAVLDACTDVVEVVQDALGKSFRPNISRPPMPAPYIIDLTRMRRAATGRVRNFRKDLHRGQTTPAPEKARLALLRCGIPAASYSSADIARYVRDGRNDTLRVGGIAKTAMHTAAKSDAAFLALPECFLPEEIVEELLVEAEELGIGLVAGVEYKRDQMISNAVIALPGIAGAVHQQKQTPSRYEVPVTADGVVRKFLDTKLGVLGVVVCSDLLELDFMWALAASEPRVDTVIVCARNPHPDLFESLAAADAIRLHAHVAVVNAYAPDKDLASGQGTSVFAPRRAGTTLEPSQTIPLDVDEWDEIELPELAMWDLPVGALALRDTHDTMHGYIAAPHFTQSSSRESDLESHNGAHV
jgi:hypothetical protein